MVTSHLWREYLWKRAAEARLDRVKKSAPEKDRNYPLYFTERLGEKSASGSVAPNRRRRHVWTTPKSEAWLDRFRKAAGETLNPAALNLHDPGPITRWLNRGFTEADVFAGIKAVRQRHEGGERSQSVWTWEYFEPAVVEARNKRVAVSVAGGTPNAAKASTSGISVDFGSCLDAPMRRTPRRIQRPIINTAKQWLDLAGGNWPAIPDRGGQQ